jgi:hypothetical protein
MNERSISPRYAGKVSGEANCSAKSWKHCSAHAVNALPSSISLLHGMPLSSDIATSGDWEAKATAPTAGRIAIHKDMTAARTARVVDMQRSMHLDPRHFQDANWFARRHGRSAVNISNRANGALGEHRRHETDGIRLEIEAPWCRSSVRRSIEPNCLQAGQEKLSHGTPAAISANLTYAGFKDCSISRRWLALTRLIVPRTIKPGTYTTLAQRLWSILIPVFHSEGARSSSQPGALQAAWET